MGLDQKQDEYWMRKALSLAIAAAQRGEVPVGAILVNEGQVIAKAGNQKESLASPLGHAEMIVLHRASKKLRRWRLTDCTLYVTLEPCLMCAGAIWQARVGRVVYGAPDPKSGGLGSLYHFHNDDRLNHRYPVRSGVMQEECVELLQNFFKSRRNQNKLGKQNARKVKA